MEEDGYGEFCIESVYTTLSLMRDEGRIIKTGRGVYCLPEFTTQKYESPEKTLGQRITAALWQAGRPLRWQEIHWLTETDNLGKINPESLMSALSPIVGKNLVVRTERGVYSLPEFSYTSEKKPNSYITKAEITGKIVNILNEAGGSAPTEHIYLLLTAGNLRGLSLKHVSDTLNRLAQTDEIKQWIIRTAENTYCLPELAEQEYGEFSPRIEHRLLSILQAAGRPLHRHEMYCRAEESEYGMIRLDSMTGALYRMANKGLVIRIIRGVYSMPEFVNEYYELPKLNIPLRVYLTLLEAGRPLHTTKMHHFVNADDQNRISLSGLQNSIASMAKARAIVRVERGVYSLPEFADKGL